MVGDNLINLSPVWQSTDTTVVDKPVCLQLSREVIVVLETFFRIVLVDSPEFNSTLSAPFYSLIQELAFAYAPENELDRKSVV